MDITQIIYLIVAALIVLNAINKALKKADYVFPENDHPTPLPQDAKTLEELLKKFQQPDKAPPLSNPPSPATAEASIETYDTATSAPEAENYELANLFKEAYNYDEEDIQTMEREKLFSYDYGYITGQSLSALNSSSQQKDFYNEPKKKTANKKLARMYVYSLIFPRKY